MKAAAPKHESARHLQPFRYDSVAATHPGCVRALNEDACLDLPLLGLWAVSDGMGGHQAGDVASATVIEALRGVSTVDSAYAFRGAVRRALQTANSELLQRSTEILDTIGATVVTMIVHGTHYACLWAGDSRAYLWRAGKLVRITRDHTLTEELTAAGNVCDIGHRPHANVVTRAVGATAKLEPDCVYGVIEPGDRFLLCSDGLTIISEVEIATALRSLTVMQAVGSLIGKSIDAGAPDNVTAIVVEAHGARPGR